MDIQLGSKNPTREISLGRAGSIIFAIIFLAIMLLVTYGLINFFGLLPENGGETFIRCVDGTVEKIEEGVFSYCGEYVGADTPEGVKKYLANLAAQSNPLEGLDFGINLTEDFIEMTNE